MKWSRKKQHQKIREILSRGWEDREEFSGGKSGIALQQHKKRKYQEKSNDKESTNSGTRKDKDFPSGIRMERDFASGMRKRAFRNHSEGVIKKRDIDEGERATRDFSEGARKRAGGNQRWQNAKGKK